MHNVYSKLAATLALASALLLATTAGAMPVTVELDYSNLVNSWITFDGHSHFSFTPTGTDFKITSGGAATGLTGGITGTYTIGTVTTVGGLSTAAVTGTGSFVVNDGHGFNLVGSLAWMSIAQFGTGDFLNTAGAINLTGITYHGTNSELKLLAAIPSTATDVLSFQFTPAKTLAKLKTTANKTSFSGSIIATRIVADTGSTMILMGLALSGCALIRRRRAA